MSQDDRISKDRGDNRMSQDDRISIDNNKQTNISNAQVISYPNNTDQWIDQTVNNTLPPANISAPPNNKNIRLNNGDIQLNHNYTSENKFNISGLLSGSFNLQKDISGDSDNEDISSSLYSSEEYSTSSSEFKDEQDVQIEHDDRTNESEEGITSSSHTTSGEEKDEGGNDKEYDEQNEQVIQDFLNQLKLNNNHQYNVYDQIQPIENKKERKKQSNAKIDNNERKIKR